MARNSIGKNLVLTSFGESHGVGVGAVLDGFPARFVVDLSAIQTQLARRKPGQHSLTTSRPETDELEILSGLFEGKTTGSPLAFFIRNRAQNSSDYNHLEDAYRPGHADLGYQTKYGHRDHRGGGRSSARITAAWVAAGALAMQWLQQQGIVLRAWVHQVHNIAMPSVSQMPSIQEIESNPVRCPDKESAIKMQQLILNMKECGNTVGGLIAFQVDGLPMGIGEPVFGKVQAELGHYLLNINATTGLEFGAGFQASSMTGLEHNDAWILNDSQQPSSQTNHAGGSIGGITTGLPLIGKLAFKPVSSIQMQQQSLNTKGETIHLTVQGRHDPCVLPRAVPIVESMIALCLMDLVLEQQ